MQASVLRALEFNRIRDVLARDTNTLLGRARALALTPTGVADDVRARLDPGETGRVGVYSRCVRQIERSDRRVHSTRRTPRVTLSACTAGASNTETNRVGVHLYDARDTPQMFVVDPTGTLIYGGAIDDRPTADPASLQGATNYVSQALTEAMAGQPLSKPLTPPYGCTVKYAR